MTSPTSKLRARLKLCAALGAAAIMLLGAPWMADAQVVQGVEKGSPFSRSCQQWFNPACIDFRRMFGIGPPLSALAKGFSSGVVGNKRFQVLGQIFSLVRWSDLEHAIRGDRAGKSGICNNDRFPIEHRPNT